MRQGTWCLAFSGSRCLLQGHIPTSRWIPSRVHFSFEPMFSGVFELGFQFSTRWLLLRVGCGGSATQQRVAWLASRRAWPALTMLSSMQLSATSEGTRPAQASARTGLGLRWRPTSLCFVRHLVPDGPTLLRLLQGRIGLRHSDTGCRCTHTTPLAAVDSRP